MAVRVPTCRRPRRQLSRGAELPLFFLRHRVAHGHSLHLLCIAAAEALLLASPPFLFFSVLPRAAVRITQLGLAVGVETLDAVLAEDSLRQHTLCAALKSVCGCRKKKQTVNAHDGCATSLCTVTAHVHVHARPHGCVRKRSCTPHGCVCTRSCTPHGCRDRTLDLKRVVSSGHDQQQKTRSPSPRPVSTLPCRNERAKSNSAPSQAQPHTCCVEASNSTA